MSSVLDALSWVGFFKAMICNAAVSVHNLSERLYHHCHFWYLRYGVSVRGKVQFSLGSDGIQLQVDGTGRDK